jgi:hypothetical protein
MNPRANGALIGSTFERSGPWVQRADFEQAADTVIRSPSARPTSISRSHVKSLGIPRPRRSRSRALTWGADEKVLLALAAAGWPQISDTPFEKTHPVLGPHFRAAPQRRFTAREDLSWPPANVPLREIRR